MPWTRIIMKPLKLNLKQSSNHNEFIILHIILCNIKKRFEWNSDTFHRCYNKCWHSKLQDYYYLWLTPNSHVPTHLQQALWKGHMFYWMGLCLGCRVNQEHCRTCHFLLSWQALLEREGRLCLLVLGLQHVACVGADPPCLSLLHLLNWCHIGTMALVSQLWWNQIISWE